MEDGQLLAAVTLKDGSSAVISCISKYDTVKQILGFEHCEVVSKDLIAETSAVKILKVEVEGSTSVIFYSKGKLEACLYKNLVMKKASCKSTKLEEFVSTPKEFLPNSKYGTLSLPLIDLDTMKQLGLLYNIAVPNEGTLKPSYNFSKENSIDSAFESGSGIFEILDFMSYNSMRKSSSLYTTITFDSRILEDSESESETFNISLQAEFEMDPESTMPPKQTKSIQVTVLDGYGPTETTFNSESFLMYTGKEYNLRFPRSQIRGNNPKVSFAAVEAKQTDMLMTTDTNLEYQMKFDDSNKPTGTFIKHQMLSSRYGFTFGEISGDENSATKYEVTFFQCTLIPEDKEQLCFYYEGSN